MRMQKIFFVSVLILTAVFAFSNSAKAVTAEELTSQIQALQQQLSQLQVQLAQLQSQNQTNTTPLSVSLTSPNGGETLVVGMKHTIAWTSSGFASNAKVFINLLNSSDVSVSTITINLPDKGSYLWTVPNKTGDYKVRVTVASSTNGIVSKVQDVSENTFSIVVPSVKLTLPKTNDVFYAEKTYTAAWTSSGFSSSAKVSLNLLDASYKRIPVASGLANTGSYEWTTPTTVGTYKMAVTISEAGVSKSFTSNSFIVKTAPTLPSITVTSPNGGETWQVGTKQTIKWTPSQALTSPLSYVISLINSVGTSTQVLVNIVNYGTVPTQNDITIPSTLSAGSYQAEVKFTLNGGQIISDKSDNYFTIAAAVTSENISKDQLASISDALSQIAQQLQNLLNK